MQRTRIIPAICTVVAATAASLGVVATPATASAQSTTTDAVTTQFRFPIIRCVPIATDFDGEDGDVIWICDIIW